MKEAINVKKGRKATTNEAIKFVFIQAVKATAVQLQEDRNIEFGSGVNVFIEDDEMHHITKVANAFLKKYEECSEIVTGRVEVKRTIITD